MNRLFSIICLIALAALIGMVVCAPSALALERPDVTFKVFQFPADQIPRIDGKTDDWAMVPDAYSIGIDQCVDDEGGHSKPDPNDLDFKVKVGWVKGMNRLYFLYEATDNYWDFSRPDLHNDIFEVVVDGDASGGPLIDAGHADVWNKDAVGEMANRDTRLTVPELHWASHGVHAQNYHIFTPAKDKDWCMAWSSATWIKELPFANSKCVYDFKPGEGGKLILEFWITPFDYAGPEGPQRAVESILSENKIIGASFAVIDYDDVNSNKRSFWNLSRKHTMFGNASQLCAFKLMPFEPQFTKPIEANWSYKVVDMDRRLVAFKDESQGKVTSWKWTFGDGQTSTEQNPIHQFNRAASFVTILEVEGPDGTSKRSKVWDVSLK
ncbi:MAG TPA: PKD domain-containing protein [Tepidisphaeraceae bacterium]|nr:PKD domain-containing protein [Tepidisphaeraceae bacterium]